MTPVANAQSSSGAKDAAPDSIRIATFNVSFNRPVADGLRQDLAAGDAQAYKVAAILRKTRPDIILLNEFDHDEAGESLRLFQQSYLQAPTSARLPNPPLIYEHAFTAEVNTGQPSGLDLNRDGKADGPADAFGFGQFPGQYGMVVLSRFPIQQQSVRTFQKLLWASMPDAAKPSDPDTNGPWYSDDVWSKLRLSSKSHWDVPIQIGQTTIHMLACHPTPPAFDGKEDRNGRRNHDEIRLWADYVSPEQSAWIADDQGQTGGLADDASFVVAGDLNADPADGDSHNHAIQNLLKHPRIDSTFIPSSEGGLEASAVQKKANVRQSGQPAYDTADFSDRSVGNLRVDYVLPSNNLKVVNGGVFWPKRGEEFFDEAQCSDHHLVWIDVQPNDTQANSDNSKP